MPNPDFVSVPFPIWKRLRFLITTMAMLGTFRAKTDVDTEIRLLDRELEKIAKEQKANAA